MARGINGLAGHFFWISINWRGADGERRVDSHGPAARLQIAVVDGKPFGVPFTVDVAAIALVDEWPSSWIRMLFR
jgi:hypothetical protein